jgi:hypothetical protein
MEPLIIGLLIAGIVLEIVTLIGVAVFGFLLLDRTKLIPHFSSQLDLIESMVVDNAAGEPQMMTGAFRSLDGRHIAGTLPELMDKMLGDPLNQPSDPTTLGELFNGEVDDDEDDEPPEDWKKHKK